MKHTLIVVGGGAAGFFCAVNAARLHPPMKVILLEKSGKLLSKVRISGGGRCNVTHACFDREEMSRHYPRGRQFVKKAFHHFFTTDTIQWFQERGVMLKQEEDGRMFPVTDDSLTIVECLLREASQYGVDVRLHAGVCELEKGEKGFSLLLENGQLLEADSVCLACGGYPRSSMFEWIRRTGHDIVEPVPSLFTFNAPGHPITALMGVSVAGALVRVPQYKLEQTGPLLITHWGLSGPAVLKLSARGAREMAKDQWTFLVRINWLPAPSAPEVLEQLKALRHESASVKARSRNPFGLPQRLWEFLLAAAGFSPDWRWADVPAAGLNRLHLFLTQYELPVKGKTTFKEEFVTAGGVSLKEIDHLTMMSKRVPGLFFAGEIMDVDGVTGGFNFQHAWTSGYLAASAIAARAGE